MTIPIEVSARHIHLSPTDWRKLFPGDGPSVAMPISQPPQFLAQERLTIEGPAGVLEQVALVGPLRDYTQVELAQTDARRLGIQAPLRDSGQLQQAAEITLTGPAGSIRVPAAIVPGRHIHLNPTEAQNYGLHDGQTVSVTVDSPRGGVFHHVLVRVHPDFSWRMHIDTDEANAFGIGPNATGQVQT